MVKGRENLTPISILASQKIRIFNINAFDPSNFKKLIICYLKEGLSYLSEGKATKHLGRNIRSNDPNPDFPKKKLNRNPSDHGFRWHTA